MNIYSKKEEKLLLHIVNKKKNIKERLDLTPNSKDLQVSYINNMKKKKCKSHKHLEINRNTNSTSECWIVIRGKISIELYDIDNSILYNDILEQGNCLITFRGGHSYTSLEDNTLIYEIKNGPYYGSEKDRVYI